MPIKRKTRGILNQPRNLSPRKVLCHHAEFLEIHVVSHNVVSSHFVGMDFEDLETALGIGKVDFHFYFESAWAEEGFVDHVDAVCHADYEDVIELVDTIHFGEELVDNGVAYAGSTACSPTLLRDGIKFVKDNDVQITCIAFLFILQC
jgi:hypothetical protein